MKPSCNKEVDILMKQLEKISKMSVAKKISREFIVNIHRIIYSYDRVNWNEMRRLLDDFVMTVNAKQKKRIDNNLWFDIQERIKDLDKFSCQPKKE